MMTLAEIEAWLGPGLFFVPQRPETKIPRVKYTEETMESTHRRLYRAMLEESNVAIRLGFDSGGFCAFDFDDDDSLAAFLAVNPGLATSARWKGKRGCQIGVRILGEYPKSCAHRSTTEFVEAKDGKKIGKPLYEWRATGNLSTVKGIHPSGCEYQVLVPNPPAEMTWGEINWPKGWPVPGAKDPVECSRSSSTLHMAKDSYPGLNTQTVFDLFSDQVPCSDEFLVSALIPVAFRDFCRGNVFMMNSLRNNDYGIFFS